MTITQVELDAIHNRVDAATEGPWKVYDLGKNPSVSQGTTVDDLEVADVYVLEDAEFIAAAREDVPKLLEEVERLRNENESLAITLEMVGGCYDE